MKGHPNGEIEGFVGETLSAGVILGLDGGTTSTVCICIPATASIPFTGTKAAESIEILSRASAGCSNFNSVGAMASGTLGKLHGCVLIAGTGSIAYGFCEDGRRARAAGAGPILGDWGSGYGIAAQALTAVIRAHDGRGPQTILTNNILNLLGLSSPDEIIGWTYADSSWARIAALVPVVVASAEAGDEAANKILHYSVQELADSVKAVIQRLKLSGEDGNSSFPLVMVGGVLEANNKKWDIGKEVLKHISKDYPGVFSIHPEVEPAVGAALIALNQYTISLRADQTS
ncbi:N-acetyl-D-glucosamine kinase isoform X2 [Phalaenopsis equestris]|uniref:N-acetyl-D-glucosamine kinase isoform X2 n=1 Tax=Phalaenopsis equestris TaxID=78828 RepID=UPI0009E5C81D|nr:N-acetyl-D-glucosamine kinase isoform X2 [Phalaenopsis equestris]